MKYRVFFMFLMLLLAFSCVTAQQKAYFSQSKKAIKKYDKGVSLLRAGHADMAIDYMNQALAKDPQFVDAYMVLGDIYSQRKQDRAALKYYYKALNISDTYYPKLNYMVARIEQDQGHYARAAELYRAYLQSPQRDPRLEQELRFRIRSCDVSAELVAHPVSFNPQNLGEHVNSPYDEYVNAVNTENDLLIFTVKHPSSNPNARRQVEDFYYSRKKDGLWQERRLFSSRFNSAFDEGAMTISPDGKMLIFASNRAGGQGRYDLYYSVKKNGQWMEPANMGPGVNTRWWESQPSIAADNKTVYFVSDRPHGYGGSDIYSVSLQDNGFFGEAMNLGGEINTPGNEMTPYVHPDGRTMYFVSNGLPGLGGTDIFIARKNPKGYFANPVNIGYPINSPDNELGLIVAANGELSYMSSNRKEGLGAYDIYAFNLYPEARPVPVTYLKGLVFDKETGQKLGADFELVDLSTGKKVVGSHSDDKDGSFLLAIPFGKNYALSASHHGYFFYSENFFLDTAQADPNKPFLKNVPLTPIKKGMSIILRNVFFATDRYDLKQESIVELNRLVSLLKANPTLKLEVEGHTDSRGDDEHNMMLSENRAKAVYNYLVDSGISATRLRYKGYGETRPIADNNTEEGRQANRRTEVHVIDF